MMKRTEPPTDPEQARLWNLCEEMCPMWALGEVEPGKWRAEALDLMFTYEAGQMFEGEGSAPEEALNKLLEVLVDVYNPNGDFK